MTVDNLHEKGLVPLSGQEVTAVILNKTLIGEYISTPHAQIKGKTALWMEYFGSDGQTDYRYCESKKSDNWDCAKRVKGHWQLKENEICFKYKTSAIYNRCFQMYVEEDVYLLVATTHKASGYLRAKIYKTLDGFVEESPFNS